MIKLQEKDGKGLKLTEIMSRKPAPPKPEELIAKLDEKFEAFKEDLGSQLGDKTAEIEQLKLKNDEFTGVLEKYREEDKAGLNKAKSSIEELFHEKLEALRRDLGKRIEEMTVKISSAASGSSGTESRIQVWKTDNFCILFLTFYFLRIWWTELKVYRRRCMTLR